MGATDVSGRTTSALVALVIVAGACSTSGTSPTDTEFDPPPNTTTSTVAHPAAPSGDHCATVEEGQPLQSQAAVPLERIYDQDGLTVDAALYPHPDYSGNPWSQWGQGVVASAGRFYSAIGDHLGADGNSFIYEYDPESNELVRVADILGSTDHNSGAWGFGKVHAQMALGPCDEVFFTTYWGTRRGLSYADGYEGDLLFHIDPYQRTLVDHGLIQAERGFPTLASAPAHGLLYTVAVEPVSNDGTFLVVDAVTSTIVFSAPSHPGYRSIAVDGAGAAYFSSATGELSVYDPDANDIVRSVDAPGSFLRAADTGTADGSIIAVMRDPTTFFTIGLDGSISILGDALGYTTSILIGAGGDEFFYLPGAHGNSAQFGATLRAVNSTNGTEREVLSLLDIVTDGLGATLGGTYNLVVDPEANRLYLGANVDPDGSGGGFGEVALLVIGLP